MAFELKIEDLTSCQEAIDLCWNFHLAECEKKLEPQAATHPLHALYYGEVAFIRAVVTEDKNDVKVAFQRLLAAHKMAKSLLRKATTMPEKIILNYVCGDSDLYDAALKFKMKSELKGGHKAWKAWKYFDAALPLLDKCDPNSPLFPHLNSCVMSAVGFFHFIISIIPQEWKWVVELLGFKGDRDKGLEELLMACADESIGTPISLMHLIWIYAFFFEDYELGNKYLTKLLQKFPTSAMGHYLGGYLHRKHGHADMSEVSFANAQIFGAEIPQFQGMSEYEIGYNCYLKQEWADAISHMQPLLDGKYGYTPPDGYRVFGTFQIGVCLWMTGKSAEATEHMKRLLPWVRKNYDYDAFSEKRAKKFLENNGFTATDTDLLIIQAQYEACNYEGCLATLDKMGNATGDALAQQTAMRAACLMKKGRVDEAMAACQAALQMKVKDSDATWVPPHALVTHAELLLLKNDSANALKSLKKALTYTSYDFSQLLGWKCKKMQDSIKRAAK